MYNRWSLYTAASLFTIAMMAGAEALMAQDSPPDSDIAEPRSLQRIQPVEPVDGISSDRIMGVIPNFQTVSDPTKPVIPLRPWQKVDLFVKETVDPFTFVSAAMGAALSQAGDGTPRYGVGMVPYSQRLGAAFMDMATQNFFSDAILATSLHEDPRYYRMGPGHSIARRVVYSLSRLVITKTDSGSERFNFSGVGGMAMGIALSNAYYPDKSVSGSVTEARFISSMTGGALGNLLPEFWPDVCEKLAKLRHKK
ncbi:MAG TPA: hypothetical protein VGL72_01045 [Bryobacteraceae bacterium]|jgi:hypothetical protein